VRRVLARLQAVLLALTLLLVLDIGHPVLALTGPSGNTSSAGALTGLVARDGVPVAGASVSLVAWPTNPILATLPAGAAVATLPVATVNSDSTGRFSIQPTAVPADYRDPEGTTNYELSVADGTRSVLWNLSLTFTNGATGGRWTTAGEPSASQGPGTSLRFDLGVHSGVGIDLPSAMTSQTAPADDVVQTGFTAVPAQSVAPACCVCVWAATNNWYYNRPEKFMAAYAWSGAKVTVTQVNGTDHQLGIGYQVSGGNWSQSGTMNLDESSGGGAEVAGFINKYIYNAVNYRDWVNSCGATQRRPASTYAFISSTTSASHPTWSYCTTYTSGTFWKTSGTNVTYSAGVNIIVLSVSAQSGWNTSTKEAWVVTSATKLCGSTSQGWVSSPQAEAHQA